MVMNDIVSFTKMQSLGNDFIIVHKSKNVVWSSSIIRYLAHRQKGIGFDQLLEIQSIDVDTSTCHYHIYNADGSQVFQCVNGTRALAFYLVEANLLQGPSVILKTDQRLMKGTIENFNEVELDIGSAQLTPLRIPYHTKEHGPFYTIEYQGTSYEMVAVNVGNPHMVVQHNKEIIPDFNAFGQTWSVHPSFPEGVNVGVMQVVNPHEIYLRVYERGSGETLACGSGACAAVVAATLKQQVHGWVRVTQKGGSMKVHWDKQKNEIKCIGTAHKVFKGEWSMKNILDAMDKKT